MTAQWQKNDFRGWSLRVGDTVFATVYPNAQKTHDIYLTGALFNPHELPPVRLLADAKTAAEAAVLADLQEKVTALVLLRRGV